MVVAVVPALCEPPEGATVLVTPVFRPELVPEPDAETVELPEVVPALVLELVADVPPVTD